MSKYSAVRTGKYASKKEAKRATELKLLEKAGQIQDLTEQVRFNLIPRYPSKGKCIERSCDYVADFSYVDRAGGQRVVEDCKGMRTREYIIKRKLMLHVHGIRIRES